MCSNRTFMELKLLRKVHIGARVGSSNRTFMELKYQCKRIETQHRTIVLIVPLWN